MIPLLTREAARAFDLDAVQRLGVSGLQLMEHAGRGAFELISKVAADRLAHVAIVGGVGQNGGDAWVVARHLRLAGHTPRCVLVGERQAVRGDAATNLGELEKLGVSVASVAAADLTALQAALDSCTAIVDGLFGTGLARPVTGVFADAIARINANGAPCFALDLPSGVDADTGAVLGSAVRATATITFAAHKRGLHQYPGAALAGGVICASLGVPGPTGSDCELIEAADVAGWVPRRAADSHKGGAGRVLIVAGSPGRTGAALLSGMGALRGGAGLVTLCPSAGARAALDAKVIELMTADMSAEPNVALTQLAALAADKDAVVLGPGLGTDSGARAIAQGFARHAKCPAVIDADALTALGTELRMLQNASAARVLTPHPGEAARLLGLGVPQVQADRYSAASRLAAESRCVVVLKGAGTVIAAPDGRLRVCSRGTPALGVAGTGDVLSGVIAALLAQLPAFDAAAAGVYLHAVAGELAARSDRGLLAREVADALPLALEQVRADR